MAKHKTFAPVTSARRRDRMHRRADGSKKIPLRYQTAKARAAEMTAANGVLLTAYKCPVCNWFHVGNVSVEAQLRHASKIDQVAVLESGERVAVATRNENVGTEEQRLAYLAKLFATVEKKRSRSRCACNPDPIEKAVTA